MKHTHSFLYFFYSKEKLFFFMCPLFKHLVRTELVFWPPEEFIVYIYGYGQTFSINHCSSGRPKTSASSARFDAEPDGAESARGFTRHLAPQRTNGEPVGGGQRPQEPQESRVWHGRARA